MNTRAGEQGEQIVPTYIEHAAMRLIDMDYQEAVARTAQMMLRDRVPEIEDPQLIFHRRWFSETTPAKLDDAVRSGTISPAQYADLHMCTLIISGRTEPGARRDILIEARVNTTTEDIAKARRRAKILRAATNIPTLPVVFTVVHTNRQIQFARGEHSFTKAPAWENLAPGAAYQQDNAQVEIIAFDPGDEFDIFRRPESA